MDIAHEIGLTIEDMLRNRYYVASDPFVAPVFNVELGVEYRYEIERTAHHIVVMIYVGDKITNNLELYNVFGEWKEGNSTKSTKSARSVAELVDILGDMDIFCACIDYGRFKK